MKLKKFSIRGFRSLKDVTWEPGDLNVLIGPNASGKSNFLRGLDLFQQAGTGDLDSAIIRQGGMHSILWGNQFGQLGWELDLEVGSAIWPPPLRPTRPIESLAYELLLRAFAVGYRVERELFRAYSQADKGFKYVERDPKETILFDSEGKRLQASPDQLEASQTVLAQTSRMFSRPEMLLFHRYLKSWGIYQDLAVQQDSPVRKAIVTRRESQLSPNGNNLVTLLHSLYTTDREFKTRVNDSMRAAFGKEFEELEFPPAEDQRIQMRLRWRSFKTAHSAADLSDGTLRFLMLVSILENRSRGDFIAIDEPETGLHPSMLPIIAELAADASRSSQIVFTTHSPEFLTALGAHHPKTTVTQNVNGETKLSVLDGDDLERWLKKYKLGEMFMAGDLEALA